MSPEAFLYNEYSEKSEVWAIGVTFYECLNGKTFDEGKDMSEVYKEIKRNGLPYRVQASEKCKNIIRWCLEQDPKKRPTCLELLNYVVSEDSTRTTPSQPVRMSFTPLENIEVKSRIFDKRDSLRTKIELVPNTIDALRKDDILKAPSN